MGILYPFLSNYSFVNLAKAQIPLTSYGWYIISHSVKVCFAAIGICVFQCVISVAHFFISIKKEQA